MLNLFGKNKNNEKYCVLVNKQELYDAAKAQGIQDVLLVTGQALSPTELMHIEECWSNVVILFYLDGNDHANDTIQDQLEKVGIWVIDDSFPNPSIMLEESIDSLEDFISACINKNQIEYELIRDGRIKDRDYTGRCGNCHEPMDEADKYCKFCGTKRGQGRFLPFDNPMYCVYGPPIKTKYKCRKCGTLWMTCALGGGKKASFCPQCGEKKLDMVDRRDIDFSSYVCTEEPYDPDNPPIFVTEEQLTKLLAQRNGRENSSGDKTLRKMQRSGFDVPDKIDEENSDPKKRYPRTETEADQLNLVEKILSLIGRDQNAYPDVVCDKCGSKHIAAISYQLLGNHKIVDECMISETTSQAPLVLQTSYIIDERDLREKRRDAFICLQCGNEFGKLTFSRKSKELLGMNK